MPADPPSGRPLSAAARPARDVQARPPASSAARSQAQAQAAEIAAGAPVTQATDGAEVAEALRMLAAIRDGLLAESARLKALLAAAHPAWQASARNLAHYLALRRNDLRPLQAQLARLGLSSLGRAEMHVLENVEQVLSVLHRMAAAPAPLMTTTSGGPSTPSDPPPVSGTALLAAHAEAVFGPTPADRRVRIMVTLPSDLAHDPVRADAMVAAGLDVARINCAHDDAASWRAMADQVRRAAAAAGRPVRVLMDLGGPKLRTGPVEPGPAVLRVRPQRDAFGRVTAAGRCRLRAADAAAVLPAAGLGSVSTAAQVAVQVAVQLAVQVANRDALPEIVVETAWLQALRPGDRVGLVDAREARRQFTVEAVDAGGAVLACGHTVYLTPGLALRRQGRRGRQGGRQSVPAVGVVVSVPPRPGELRLLRGDVLHLTTRGMGHASRPAAPGRRAQPAAIACTTPAALAMVRAGERVAFDDGRIGGVVRKSGSRRLVIEITAAREGGERLAADKGINFPDSALHLPALTAKDEADLAVAAECADLVGLSFAQSAEDVLALRRRLAALGADHLGVLLKIETRRGFEQLPALLFAAMTGPAAGVMIARGDLAVECGWERLAEVQEELLWACEAAHLPVVWATQVLEALAKTGLPSRAEITDAAMGGRAECVMLNKGAHVVEAMHTLDDILRRMQAHQTKKRPLLRALKAWTRPDPTPPVV